MNKIYPFQSVPTTWYNYSNYLNWTYEKIQAWEDYLFYFSPEFNILNESMTVLDSNTLISETTIPKNKTPEWKYIITNGEKTREVYCYFPSELKFREGYLNTHYEAYLYYDAPPNAFSESEVEKIIEIEEDEWNTLIENGIVASFPISRVIFSNKWRHRGSQTSSNPEAFDKNNFIIISKPSAVWYLTYPKNNKIEFNYQKNAMENVGSLVLFSLDFAPVRYILNPKFSIWGISNKTKSIYSSIWSDAVSFEHTAMIYNKKGGIWTDSYPIMHKLEVVQSILNKESIAAELHEAHEDFIADDVFITETVNSLNHPTSIYHISTTQEENDISDLWKNIHINLC